MPYLLLLYIVAYLDRVNVSQAQLEMSGALNFSSVVYGFGAGIFFLGYFILEIPGSIIVEKWSASGWMARIMITWGILAICTGFINTPKQFYSIRFLLGAAEAGFFPGVIIYLSHWFRYQDRAKAVAMFMAGIPISNVLGSPLSGLLMQIHWLGISGWRWLFIIEGAPAVVLGVITMFYLTDWPHQAKWLPDDERQWITEELEKEKQAKLKVRSYRVLEAFKHREIVLLTLAYFFMVSTVYGFGLWMPGIIKRISGASTLNVTLISMLPYTAGLISILVIGWNSDRTGERRWHTIFAMCTASFGLLLSLVFHDNSALAVSSFCIAQVGLQGYLPGFWSLPTSFLTGTAAAASVGLINSTGNLGGFVGPYIVGFIDTKTHSFVGGVIYLSISALIAACLIFSVRATKQKQTDGEPAKSRTAGSV
jgi:sugar phosphate permease